ncbi:hypothetical protein V3C99_005845 [Haemonchus contortus]
MSKPQRRKGNAKAASSASAAALLERSGYSTSFVGFGSGATNVFEVAAAAKAGVACKELDPDVVLILRKLSKKDPQTREKALRELLVCLKEKDREMLEICYNHFATLMDKLIVDGSPTVRMLSLRVTSFFISSLKKAAEKQLRVIMPMVLIATCDTSLSVSNQAEAVLSENFPGEKASQAESIFAADTANLAIDIIAGRHALVQSQKYDCEDSPEQRVSRLTVQCLLVIARLAQSASNNTQFKEVLESFFKQTAVIKNLTKGIPAVKSALLGICLKASDCVPLLLDTPLASWIISNLDSADSSICTKAFEAFTVLLSDERFYSKFDVQKSVVPKLLSVVRRKEVHWRHASKFFLPSYAVLVPHVNDQAKFIKSFLESFIDNLPFEIGGSMSFWAESFAECVKFTYSNKETVAETTDLNIVEVLLQSVELVREESSDCQEIITSLLLWLLERNVLSPENTTFLLDSLQLNLMNKRPQSDTTCALLVASASWPLREFHCALLRVPPLHPDFVKPLLTCSDEYLEHIDKVTNDVLAKYGLFGEPFQDGKEPPSPEEHLLTSIEKSARRALIYLSIDCEDKAHDVSLAYAAAVFPIAQMFYDTRWRCDVIPEVISDEINRWHQVFQKTAIASSRAISALLALPSSPATAQMTLHYLRYSTHSRLPLQSWSKPEKKVAWFWALHSDCSELKLGSLEQWITRFHFESEYNFLSRIYEHIQSDASEWEDSIFNAGSLGSSSWRISALCLLAALNHIDEVTLPSLPPELLDFIMCGAVTALDSCDERMDTKCENPAQLESLAGLALMLFSECDKLSCHNYGNSFDTEWPNFFLPTMARIIVRWFTFLRADSRPTFFVRSLVDALLRIKQLPDDLSLKTKLCPELDKFGYDPIHQTLIIHAEDLLPSDSVFIQFTALHMLRILSPVMYKQENGQWMEEEKVSSTGPRHLLIPDTLARMIDTATGWPSIMAFDAALMPLSSCIFSDEERVAYCDALLHSVSTILPQILARCPENIPKSKESEYFTSSNLEFNTEIYSRYAANLLYRTLGSLPAVVRNWYAGLPNTGMQIVSKYIRRYVSKLLVDAELNKVKVANQKQLKTDKLLKIRVVPVSGEVVAEYTVEETTMRLSIVMPPDWPLSVPTIQIDKAIVPSEKVKKWLLQLTAYLFHQNGSTVEGVMMWRKNVDRDVEGAEACTICMMTIHSTNHQLPKVKCRQCKNKFHSNCLYKWFESSSQTSCPLCRSNFG